MLKLAFPKCLPLVFYLIDRVDLSDSLELNLELFPNDTSLFPLVYDSNKTAKLCNGILDKIKIWVYQWKTIFNPDPQELIFSREVRIQAILYLQKSFFS